MEWFLARRASSGDATVGDLFINGQRFSYTLEDVVREIAGKPVSSWKIHGETAIPQGRYEITFEDSPKFGHETLTVNDVPSFSGVRIHAGNTAADTEGCILVGDRLGEDWIGDSRVALQALKDRARTALAAGEDIFLTITNA